MSTSISRTAVRPRLYHLPLVERRWETPKVATFRFSLGEDLPYLPGQYAALRLEALQDPRGSQRPFTLSSSPTETGSVAVTVRMTGSPFKERLMAMPLGEKVALRAPLGNFTLDPARPAVMLAAGIGVTPFRSMLRYAADRALGLRATLLVSGPREEIPFLEELEALALGNPGVRLVTDLQGGPGRREGRGGAGPSPGSLEGAVSGTNAPLYYLCGPPGAVDSFARRVTEDLGAGSQDIRFEKFTGY
jgi:ferredoxin-NADP reductase